MQSLYFFQNEAFELFAPFRIIFEHIHTGAPRRKQHGIPIAGGVKSCVNSILKVSAAIPEGDSRLAEDPGDGFPALTAEDRHPHPVGNGGKDRKIHSLVKTSCQQNHFPGDRIHRRRHCRRVGSFGVVVKAFALSFVKEFDPVFSAPELFHRLRELRELFGGKAQKKLCRRRQIFPVVGR